MTELTNSFHSTTTAVRMTRDELDALVYKAMAGDKAARAKVKRIKSRLCVSGCDCSGETGERP